MRTMVADKNNSSRQGQWWQTRTTVESSRGAEKGDNRDQRQTQRGDRGEREARDQ